VIPNELAMFGVPDWAHTWTKENLARLASATVDSMRASFRALLIFLKFMRLDQREDVRALSEFLKSNTFVDDPGFADMAASAINPFLPVG
jgi:hypothetical protein